MIVFLSKLYLFYIVIIPQFTVLIIMFEYLLIVVTISGKSISTILTHSNPMAFPHNR